VSTRLLKARPNAFPRKRDITILDMPVLDVIVKPMRLRCVDAQVLVNGKSDMKSILWTRLSSKSSRIATFIRYMPGPNLANSWSKDVLATKATPLYVMMTEQETPQYRISHSEYPPIVLHINRVIALLNKSTGNTRIPSNTFVTMKNNCRLGGVISGARSVGSLLVILHLLERLTGISLSCLDNSYPYYALSVSRGSICRWSCLRSRRNRPEAVFL